LGRAKENTGTAEEKKTEKRSAQNREKRDI
jgi:hypothetical protein